MPEMYVDVETLNFWEHPISSEQNLIGKLHLTQKVEVGLEIPDGWVECRAHVDGIPKSGFVLAKFLRSPVSPNRERLIASVSAEFMRFEHGLGNEHVLPFSDYVGEMWRALGVDPESIDQNTPWAGAAISFMVRRAGDAYASFRFSPRSSSFVHHAISTRQQADTTAPFWGYRLDEMSPEIGDMVVRSNPGTDQTVNFDSAATHDNFGSHADIVVKIDSKNNRLLAIGGNIENSVGIARYQLTASGFVSNAGHVFAILKNRTDELKV